MATDIEYNSCCCNRLDEITRNEIKSLWSNSYQVCSAKQEQRQKSCSTWSKWFRWICVAWSWVTLLVCVLWNTVVNVFWTIAGYTTAVTCKLTGASLAAATLNGILRKNLKDNIALGFGVNTPPNPIVKQDWGSPVFHDEFDGTDLDGSKWNWYGDGTKTSFPFDYTKRTEYWSPNAVEVSNGTLKLHLKKQPQQYLNVTDWEGNLIHADVTVPYMSGMIQTKHHHGDELYCYGFKQRHGFFEARCKAPNSRAAWPAFWLSGVTEWPPEIDIFEIYTTQSFKSFNSNYWWGKEGDCWKKGQSPETHEVNNVSEEFHIYACEWDGCFIKFYYDNLLVRVAHSNVNHVFSSCRIILNNAVDNLHVPENNAEAYHEYLTFPNVFEVDYVRAYRK